MTTERVSRGPYEPTPGGSVYINVSSLQWKPWRIPGSAIKVLYENTESGELTCLLKFAAGTRIPPHEHPAIEQTLVLEGTMQDHDGTAHRGDYILRRPASRHENYCPVETIVYAVYHKPNVLYPDHE
jgi:anti-sigma factor ChrR (cupin superfamily)